MTKREKSKSAITAAELMAKLEADPEWVARRDARERWHQKQDEKIGREEELLLREIADAGLLVNSVWDLVNTRESYPEAIPVLLRHLTNTNYHPRIREGIARALTVRASDEILPMMIAAFRRDPDPSAVGPKAAMGNAIEVLFDDRYVEEIAELAKDRSHGEARGMLAYALAKSKSLVAEEALQQLLSDPQLAMHATKAIERRDRQRRKRPRASE